MHGIIDIKNRIKSIKETGQITKAMELISVSKMRKANEKFQKNADYYTKVRETLKNILMQTGDISHPYLEKRKIETTAFLVVASDTGLAGEYNHRVLSFALDIINNTEGNKRVYIIGQVAKEFFLRQEITPEGEFLYCAQDPNIDDAERIAEYFIDLYNQEKVDAVRLIFTRADGRVNKAHTTRLLPLTKKQFLGEEGLNKITDSMEFEPSPKEVFDILVPQYILGITYSALIQSVRCEHMERMITMNSATKNAKEMLSSLELQFNRARQEMITTEITEISASKADI